MHKQPKRTVRRNIYGTLRGYVGGRYVDDIHAPGVEPYTPAEERLATAFLAGREDWQNAAWED